LTLRHASAHVDSTRQTPARQSDPANDDTIHNATPRNNKLCSKPTLTHLRGVEGSVFGAVPKAMSVELNFPEQRSEPPVPDFLCSRCGAFGGIRYLISLPPLFRSSVSHGETFTAGELAFEDP